MLEYAKNASFSIQHSTFSISLPPCHSGLMGLHSPRVHDLNVIVIDHPVVQTKLTELRDYTCDHRKFRALLEEIGSLMLYEVTPRLADDAPSRCRLRYWSRWSTKVLAKRVTLVPILRAGLGMAEGVLRLLPDARMGHLGVYRDEKTLEPVSYYQKFPPDIAATEVLLIDPMLATGGSAVGNGRLVSQKSRRQQHAIRLPGCRPRGDRRSAQAAPGNPDLLRRHRSATQ